jgi:hypothetical protein
MNVSFCEGIRALARYRTRKVPRETRLSVRYQLPCSVRILCYKYAADSASSRGWCGACLGRELWSIS